MGRRSFLWPLVAFILCAAAPSAVASTLLSSPVPGGAVVAFGVAYETGGRRVTHRGLDLQASGTETVRAACDGVVTFAGEVPADDGGRTRAVTIRSADGLLVCVSPLATTRVSKGEPVNAGDVVGEVAESGDGSWSAAHVHLSVREGDTYVDPAPLIVAEAVTSTGEGPTVSVSDKIGNGSAVGEPAGSMPVQAGPAAEGDASASAAAPDAARAAAPSVDGDRIRAAYAASIGVLRSPGRSPQAGLLGEMRFADSLERPTLPSTAAGHALGDVGALAALAGVAGVVAARRRLTCAAKQLIGRLN